MSRTDEQRKGYAAMVRKPYAFKNPIELQADDTIRIVRDCTCADESPYLEEPAGDQTEDQYDLYKYCGDVCGDTIPDDVYLKASDDNPDTIIIPGVCGEDGMQSACFTFSETVAASAVNGRVLGMDDWQPVAGADSTLETCAQDPCTQGGGNACDYFLFELCEGFTGSPSHVFILAGAFDNMLSAWVVKYGGKCYEIATLPCYSSEDAMSLEAEDPDSYLIIHTYTEVDDCDDDACSCCDGVMTNLDAIRDGVKERVKWINGGTLPTVAGHDWNDTAYILNSNSVEDADGDDENTQCHLRAETWRQWLAECDYWLRTSVYLFNKASTWINTTTHPAGDISGAASVTYFDATGYTTDFDATPKVDWFNSAFGLNAVGEYFTNGGEGGLGTVSALRFGDSDPHVIVESENGNETFCSLVNMTADRMLLAVEKLVGITVATGLDGATTEGKFVMAQSGYYTMEDCATMISCATTKIATDAYGGTGGPEEGYNVNRMYWGESGSCGAKQSESSGYNYGSVWKLAWGNTTFEYNRAMCGVAHGKVYCDLSTYSLGTAKVYCIPRKVAQTPDLLCNDVTFSLTGEVEAPFSGTQDTYCYASELVPVVGTNWQSGNFPSDDSVSAYTCTTNTGKGWKMDTDDFITVLLGNFTI